MIDSDSEGEMIDLEEKKNLKKKNINRFIELLRKGDNKIIDGQYANITGNPVLFHRKFFNGLFQLQGDAGARSLLERFPGEIATVEIPPEQSLDIDTPEDFSKMSAVLENRAR